MFWSDRTIGASTISIFTFFFFLTCFGVIDMQYGISFALIFFLDYGYQKR